MFLVFVTENFEELIVFFLLICVFVLTKMIQRDILPFVINDKLQNVVFLCENVCGLL